MKTITRTQFDGSTAALLARVQAHLAALQAHALTTGQPAPREEELIEALARSGETFEVEPAPEDPAPPTSEELRAAALRAIDAKAEAVRLRYITPGAGQAATYLLKAQQAHAYAAAGYSGAVPSLVQAEATARGVAAQDACDGILLEEAAWTAKAAQIELERRRGKIALATAEGEEIAAARDAAIAALEAL